MDVPTVLIGQTQSGKTFRAFRLFEAHDGPAVFLDVQYRAGHYAPDVPIVYRFEDVIAALASWTEGPPPKIAWRPEPLDESERFVEYVWSVHRDFHVRNATLPKLAVFIDEVSLEGLGDATLRLFTMAYQHDVIGIAITQRPALTNRNILGNAWDRYIFSLGSEDVETLRAYYRWELPEPSWIRDPLEHRYFRFSAGHWFAGDAEGGEREMPTVRLEDEEAVPERRRGPRDEPEDEPQERVPRMHEPTVRGSDAGET